jgi:6-O-methylguanine DNA methyltransferase, DNA binding domain
MRNCHDHGVPAHRVIASGGALGGFGGNLELKRALLRAEGILVPGRRIRNFDRLRWRPPSFARHTTASKLPGVSRELERRRERERAVMDRANPNRGPR